MDLLDGLTQRNLVTTEQLQRAHAKDTAAGLARTLISEVKQLAVSCENYICFDLPICTSQLQLSLTMAVGADISDLGRASGGVIRRRCVWHHR